MTDPPATKVLRYWLRHPEGESATAALLNTDAESVTPERGVPLEALADVPCLVLLGEAGLGKSTELEREQIRLSALRSEASEARLVRLATVTSSGDVSRYVAAVRARLGATRGTYHLLLDALDEARLDPYALGTVLGDELTELEPTMRARLRLRLTCRAAVWPAFTELLGTLRTVWPERGQVEVRDLTDLTQDDVEAIVGQRLEDRAPAFLDALSSAPSAHAFATNPHRLALLLNLAHDGALPNSERELYARGCHKLCEVGPRDTLQALAPGQRLAVAGRIAALALLTEGGNAPNDDDLVGRSEPVWLPDGGVGAHFDISRQALEEVRRTPLFVANGAFVHRAFAEYLAARRLAQHPRPLDALAYLRPRAGAEAGVVPHLRGLVAWFAAISSQVRAALVDAEPEILLASDLSDADDAFRARLVDALLGGAARGRFAPWELDGAIRRELAFPGLSEHLWTVISNEDAAGRAREVALTLATATAASELSPRLVDLALGQDAPVRLRQLAAQAVARHGTSAERLRLLPLALRGTEDPDTSDDDDELKGEALRALWPGLIDTAALLSCLSAPRNPSLWGAYAGFVHGTVVRRLDQLDLPLALGWLRRHKDWRERSSFPWRALQDALLEAAWRRWREPRVLVELARTALSALREYVEFHKQVAPGGWGPEHTEPRRAVVTAVIALLAAEAPPTSEADKLLWRWVTSDDADWLMAQLHAAESETDQRRWAILARYAFVADTRERWERFLEACASSPILQEVYRSTIGPIALGSPEADAMRREYQSLAEWRVRNEALERELEEEETEARKRPLREMRSRRAAEGDSVAWLIAARTATYGAFDVRSAPWWLAADAATKTEVCDLAAAYLDAPPREGAWHGTDAVPLPEIAGWLALMLLGSERPAAIAARSDASLTRWAGVLLVWWGVPEHDAPLHDELLARVAEAAPEDVLARLEAELCDDKPDAAHPTLMGRLPLLWSPTLADALRTWLAAERLSNGDAKSVIGLLLAHGDAPVASWAFSLVSADALSAELRVTVAAALVERDPREQWTRIWQAMTASDELGLAFVEHVTGGPREVMNPTLRHRLTEAQLATTYLWLHRHHPGRPRNRSTRMLNPFSEIDWIAQWKSDLVTALRDRGTRASVDALVGLRAELPELDWLDWTVSGARAHLRAVAWRPLTPAEASALLDARLTPWVRDADDLFDRVLGALERYQKRLHEHGPDWKALWRTPGKMPAKENDCTEVIKQRLVDLLSGATAGFSAVLEERFLASWAPGTGQEPDLVLRATTREGDTVAVVFEAKRDSHRDVCAALDAQLVDRYLLDPFYRHGIYLVYWFGRGKTPLPADLSAARALLEEQATAASRRRDRRIAAIVLDARGPTEELVA